MSANSPTRFGPTTSTWCARALSAWKTHTIAAAVVVYGLEQHVERLAEDHRHAQVIGQAVAETPGLRLDPQEVDTNLVWFFIDPEWCTAKEVAARLKEQCILVHVTGTYKIRMC